MISATKLHRERLCASARRAAILNAAIDLFSTKGFRGTTTREIAAAVGVSEPVLYQHFATKRALYDAILEAKLSETSVKDCKQVDEAAEGTDDRRFFSLLAGCMIDWYLDDPRYPRLLLFASLEQHELHEMFFERQVSIFYELLIRYLQRGAAAGRPHVPDPLLTARAFAGMLSHQGMIYSVFRAGELPAGGRDAIVNTVVNIFLNGTERAPLHE
ncbi:MAG: TetR/AcrR family transcriptional regulator [Bryobacterales bacterium]|nr:TetR/AcrR family transcriptional regulator [Bryobacterales bacterium]